MKWFLPTGISYNGRSAGAGYLAAAILLAGWSPWWWIAAVACLFEWPGYTLWLIKGRYHLRRRS